MIRGVACLCFFTLLSGALPLSSQSPCRPVRIDDGRMADAPAGPAADPFAADIATALHGTRCLTDGPEVNRVRGLLTSLLQAGGERLRAVRLVVIDEPVVNMFATRVSGRHHVVIAYTGFVTYADSVVRVGDDRVAEATARSDSYISAVLGHELAHVLLGHTDSLPCDFRRGEAATPALPLSAAAGDLPRGFLACRQRSQQWELDADSVGAVLTLQARGELALKHFGDLVRFWEIDDETMRQSELDLASTRVTSTHPSGTQRAAALMRQWAALLEVQDRFDAASALLAANIARDRARALLDSVALVVPAIPVLDEARAALEVAEWLASVSTDALRLAPSIAVSQARFVDVARRGSVPGDRRLLLRARQALEALPNLNRRGASLSNLAVLEVLQGDVQLALDHARRASALLPKHLAVLNNQIFVLHAAGKTDSAFALANRTIQMGPVRGLGVDLSSMEAWGDRCLETTSAPDVIAVCFNWLRMAFDRAPTLARHGFRVFARRHAGWPWAREAARLADAASAPEDSSSPTTAPRPSAASDEWALRDLERATRHPLGDPVADVLFGIPQELIRRQRDASGSLYQIPSLGVMLHAGAGSTTSAVIDGVTITNTRRWTVADIRIGDEMTTVHQHLGTPTEVHDDAEVWRRGPVALAVTYRAGRVVGAALVRRSE